MYFLSVYVEKLADIPKYMWMKIESAGERKMWYTFREIERRLDIWH